MSQELYNAVQWQNDILNTSYTKMHDSFSVDNKKVKYLLDNMNWYVYINYYLWFLYYLLCLGVLYCIFFGKEQGYSFIFKLTILILFLAYPLMITPIEDSIMEWAYYLYAVFRGSVYQPKNNHNSAIYLSANPMWTA